MALVVEWEIPTFASADPLGVRGPAFFSTSALIFPPTDMVVVLEFTLKVDFFNSNTQALELAPSNLGQNSVVSGTAHFSPAFVGPERSVHL